MPSKRAVRVFVWALLLGLAHGCASLTEEPLDSVVLGDGSVFEAYPEDARGVTRGLLAQYRAWRGAPYKLGGESKAGVDCSAFVQITLREHFGVEVPRTTAAQSKQGEFVERPFIRPGDLVFFRTGPTRRHVGFYLGRGQFLHASTRVGVTIGRLDDPYWDKSFWTARRIL
ncbi:MAG TPA: NlpC/P60 family protein [Limnobacter sp.]|nr:NlpC/P60 family protein [Limnobacter sp.]